MASTIQWIKKNKSSMQSTAECFKKVKSDCLKFIKSQETSKEKFSNKDIPVGKCLLFPGQVTHGHLSTKLESGTKYSLTIWSSRYEGDIN